MRETRPDPVAFSLVGSKGKVDVFVRSGNSTKITGPLQRAHANPKSPINIRPEL